MNNNTEYQAYLFHLQADHRASYDAVRVILEYFDEPQLLERDSATRQGLIDELEGLHYRLRSQLSLELEDARLAEAVSRSLRLRQTLRSAESEHRELIAQLGGILESMEQGPRGVREIERVEQEFRRFAKALLAHTSEENRIVQHGFNAADPPEDFE